MSASAPVAHLAALVLSWDLRPAVFPLGCYLMVFLLLPLVQLRLYSVDCFCFKDGIWRVLAVLFQELLRGVISHLVTLGSVVGGSQSMGCWFK